MKFYTKYSLIFVNTLFFITILFSQTTLALVTSPIPSTGEKIQLVIAYSLGIIEIGLMFFFLVNLVFLFIKLKKKKRPQEIFALNLL
jgi:hypothetical protein